MTRQEAVRRAVEAVRRYEREGHAWGRENAVEALENALGPLDWSHGGEGFRLLRRVAERAFGPDYGQDRREMEGRGELGGSRGLLFYDRYRVTRNRLSGRKAECRPD